MNIALILSGGVGARFHDAVPKQYKEIAGKRIISYVIDAAREAKAIDLVLVAAHGDYREMIEGEYHCAWTASGETRNETLRNGLEYIKKNHDCRKLAVLDAVRPFVTGRLLDDYMALLDDYQAVATAKKITDELGSYDAPRVSRERYYLLSSPEAYDFDVAYRHFDARSPVTEALHQFPPDTRVFLNFVEFNNLKITWQDDFRLAELMLTKGGNGPGAPSTLRRLQETELEIMDELVRICEKHQLTYFLTGGTMLGAVRHQGFIPWDDDVDIGMPREDYEKFFEICEHELIDKYYVVNKDYHWTYAKICKKNTLFVEGSHGDKKEFWDGIFIDVFPYDNAVGGRFTLRLQDYLISKCETMYLYKTGEKKAVSVWGLLLRTIALLLPKRVIKKLWQAPMRVFRKKDTPYFVQWTGDWRLKKEFFDKSIFFPLGKIVFEGKEYPCPRDADAYLRQMYGDYTRLPPPAERKAHNPRFIVFGPAGGN